jgi:hypothetical protein
VLTLVVRKEPEKVEVVADGHGNPPEVLTGTLWLVNVAVEFVLLNVPKVVAGPFGAARVVHVWPRMLALAVRPF